MAYTFMDDYGTEWTMTTANPFYKHHHLVSFVRIAENHEVLDGACHVVVNEQSFPCHDEKDYGIVWSSLLAVPDAEVEASVFWKYELLDMHMENVLIERLKDKKTENEKMDVYDKWYDWRDEQLLEFYKQHPEHPDGKDWIADLEEELASAN